jgi:hypothetical protein
MLTIYQDKPAPTLVTMPNEVLDRIFHAVIPEFFIIEYSERPKYSKKGSKKRSASFELSCDWQWVLRLRLVSKRMKEVVDPIILESHSILPYKAEEYVLTVDKIYLTVRKHLQRAFGAKVSHR